MEDSQPPLFSIVLPTHNRAQMLCRAIASVLKQTFDALELIVVDDASEDATVDVVTAYHDPRLRYIRLEQNAGASAARNAGIRAANGKYIAFLDDDDEYLPDFLSKMAAALQNAPVDVGFAWCGVRRVRQTSSGLEVVRIQTWESDPGSGAADDAAGMRHLQVGTGFGLTVRADCFDKIGMFDENLQAAVDTDLMFRLGKHYEHIVVSEALVTVHLHDGDQLTDKNERRAAAIDRLIQNNIDVIARHDDLWIRYHRGAAALHYGVGNRRRGRAMIRRALTRKPMRWQTWKSWLCYETFGHENLGLRSMILPTPHNPEVTIGR